MVHFAGSTIFGHIDNPNPFTGSTEQSDATKRFLAADQIQDVIDFGGTGTFTNIVDSLKNTTSIFDTLRTNLSKISTLGEISSIQTSTINELITVREEDLKKIQEAFTNQLIIQDVTKEQSSKVFQEAKETLSKQLDSLAGVLGVTTGTAAVIIGGIALLFVVRK